MSGTPNVFIKPERRVRRVFIHCSASDLANHDDVDVIRAWHEAKGFDDVGYHFFIQKNGNIQLGRSLEKVPAAQYLHNIGTIAICVHGLVKERFTAEQFDALKRLCKQINAAYKGSVSFHGHCEVSKKECPVFDYKAVLNLTKNGYMEVGDGFD